MVKVFKLFVDKIADFVFRRTAKQAANPAVQYARPTNDLESEPNKNYVQDDQNVLFGDAYIKTEHVLGVPFELITIKKNQESPDGKIIGVENMPWILVGCGHMISQLQATKDKNRQVRGFGNICVYCQEKYFPLLEKGAISPFDFNRLTFVCSQCARLTLSGKPACPKHTREFLLPDGKKVYLGPEEINAHKRQQLISSVLTPIRWLLSDNENNKS